ncbi:hypothetical protein [Streptomyces sp. NPDC000880]
MLSASAGPAPGGTSSSRGLSPLTDRGEAVGRDALRQLSDTFYEATLADPPLAPVFVREVSADPAGTDLGDPGPTPRWGWKGLR